MNHMTRNSRSNNRLYLVILSGISLLALASAQSATAQTATSVTESSDQAGQIKEVTVTAERRKSTVQKTASSISVRNGQDLLTQGRLQLSDILADVPGVSGGPNVSASGNTSTSASNPYANIVIRGVLPDQTGDNTEIPTTAVYTDEVYQGLGSDYDISRVEVLRGPQGTLYGRSATGGVIAIHTNDPVIGKFQANLNVTYGNYDLRDVQAAVNLPINSTLALRIAGREFDELGYINYRAGSQSKGESRAKLLYKPNDKFSVLLGVATEEDHSHQGGPAYELVAPNDLQVESTTAVTPVEVHQHQFWANINADLGWATATYIPTFRRAYYAPVVSYVGPATGAVGINPSTEPLDQYITQEARLTSDPGTRLSWIGGVFYFNNMNKTSNYLDWIASGAEAFATDQRKITQDVGVFGETTYPVNSALRLTAGLRYDYTAVDHTESYANNITGGAGGPTSPTFDLPEDLSVLTLDKQAGFRSFNNVTYKIRAEYDLAPQNMIYGSVSSGFLPGDVQVSTLSSGQPYAAPYNEETLTAFEVGSKNRFLDNQLQLNAAAYYYIYSGYQQDVELTPQTPGSAHITFTSPARMYGLDLESTYRFTANDSFSLTAGLIKAEFQGDPAFDIGGTIYYFQQAVAQKSIAGIPPITLTARYDHTFVLPDNSNLVAHADMQYFSAYDESEIDTLGGVVTYAGAEPYVHLAGQALGNMALTWTSASGKYSVGGFVRNVGNTIYKTGVNVQYNGVIDATPSIGRTYGATLHLSY